MVELAERTNRTRNLSLLAVAVTVLAWASAFVGIRSVGASYEPGPLALGRLTIGTVALGLILLVQRRWVRPDKKQWLLIASFGVFWFAIYNVALNAAEQRVDAGTTAMLVNIGPILIALFAGLLLGEGFPRWLIIGAAVAFSGALLIGIVTAASGSSRDGTDLLGIVLCVVAAITYAIGVLSQKPVLRGLPAIQVTWMGCAIGMVCCFPFAPGLIRDVGNAPGSATAGLVYLGIVPTALAFTTWAYALSTMDAGRLGISTYLVPPLTIGLAWLLLSEIPVPLAFVGGAICLLGVGLSRRRDRVPEAGGRRRVRT